MIAVLRRQAAPHAKRAAMGLGLYAAVRRLRPHRGVAILRYHAVCDPARCDYASPEICLSPAEFERQVAYLSSRYRVLPLPEVAAAYRDGRTLPSNAVVFTFDDGYADNLEAARTLARHGATGTFYLTAGCIGGGDPFWLAEVRQLVSRAAGDRLVLRAAGVPLDVALDPSGPRTRAIRAVTKLIKSVPIPVREALREELREVAGRPSLSDPMLDWRQVREMAQLGMTIGAHTMTHPNLPSAGLEAAREEIAGSKRRLEDETGQAVTMFSYPNGGAERYYTPELQRVVAEAGFACATTSQNGFASPESDLYALKRIEVAQRLDDLVFALEVERFAFRPR